MVDGNGQCDVAEGPRERILRIGPAALTDAELLAVLFGTGSKGNPVGEMAQRLLSVGGGLRALSQADPQELVEFRGLGPARAAQMLAALELGRRVQEVPERRPRIASSVEMYRYLRPKLAAQRREEFHVLCFNGRNVLLRDVKIAEGTMNLCPVDPREVFAPALAARSTFIVLAHNHPSGDATPSSRDIALTRQLARGALLLGLMLMDHIIVGDGGFRSMREMGVLGDGNGPFPWP